MTKSLITKQFEAHRVRIVTKEDGEVWFVAKDVCEALSIKNVTQALDGDLSKNARGLEPEEKLTYSFYTSGQKRKTRLVSESGLYALIMRSNKPEARKFRRWVTGEVLPEIFKTGRYALNPETSEYIREKTIGGVKWYNYDQWLYHSGGSLRSGSYSARRRRLPGHFIKIGDKWYISEYARDHYAQIAIDAKRYNLRLLLLEDKENKAVKVSGRQGQLTLNF